MTLLFNRLSEKAKRRALRKDMPKAEVLLWAQLRSKQVAGVRFHRQSSIGPYVVDFYAPAARLAIEIDGDSHLQPGAQQADQRRQALIETLGVRVVRFSNTAVYEDMEGVVAAIEALVVLRRRGNHP